MLKNGNKKMWVFAVIFAAAGLAQAHGQTIPAPQARDIALGLTGGGAVTSLELTSGDGGQIYQIVVINNAERYDITINAQTGAVISLRSGQTGTAAVPQTAAPEAAQQGGIFIGNVVPRQPAVRGGPANPPVSAQRAAEIARDHLISIGITRARFDYVYMDRERGRWVWSVEFDGDRGRDFEFYIDVNTGEIIHFSID